MSEGAGDDNQPPRVGYRRPPVGTRFKKGQSGNPGGRPRKREPTAEAILELLNRSVTVQTAGRRRRMSAREARLRSTFKKACSGDLSAIDYCLGLFKKFEAIPRMVMTEGGVVLIPDGMQTEICVLLLGLYGRGPWSADEIADAERMWAGLSEEQRAKVMKR